MWCIALSGGEEQCLCARPIPHQLLNCRIEPIDDLYVTKYSWSTADGECVNHTFHRDCGYVYDGTENIFAREEDCSMACQPLNGISIASKQYPRCEPAAIKPHSSKFRVHFKLAGFKLATVCICS